MHTSVALPVETRDAQTTVDDSDDQEFDDTHTRIRFVDGQAVVELSLGEQRIAGIATTHHRHLVEVEETRWNADTALRGAQERLTSILITALVTALALLPIAMNSDNPGREIMGPMAAVIIGGLTSSMALNLLILPTISLHCGRFEPREPQIACNDGR